MNHKNLKLFKILHDLSAAARDMTRVAKRTCQVRVRGAASLRSITAPISAQLTHSRIEPSNGQCHPIVVKVGRGGRNE